MDLDDHLWIFCDGSDVASLKRHRERIHAQHVTLVCINVSTENLYALGHVDDLRIVNDRRKIPLWTQLQIEGIAVPQREKQHIFLSHAVADELQLHNVVSFLRETLHHNVFSCSDSILAGAQWYEEITAALKDSDVVLCMLSKAFARSTFCAFEIGMARALQKKIRLISLDDTIPPSYAQDIQMISVPRYRASHPWLNEEEAILECVLLG